MSTQIEYWPLGLVSVCPLNPRKRVDAAGIEEMAESILEHGIIQPPIARLVEECEDAQRVEIVFGQRRYLGAVRAREIGWRRELTVEAMEDLQTIPLIVRAMSDRQVVEEAWVENLQRVDVSVREESEGFDSLLALRDDDGEPVYTQASLAKKLGKSVAFLSQRLKLRHVPEVLWSALDERRVSVRHLERVGTVADPKAREKLAQEILAPKYQSEPLSTRQTEDLIEAEYRKSLKGVVWDASDAELVPVVWSGAGLRLAGGSCEDCPHRTGNVPELQDGLQRTAGIGKGTVKGIDPRVCLLPSCHRAKEEAHWARLSVDAEAGGLRVLSDGEAAKVFRNWGGDFALMPGSPFVAVASKPGYSETGHHGQDDLPTWEELLAGTGYESHLVLGRNPHTGAVVRLLDRDRAIKLAEVVMKERGEVSPFADRPKPAAKAAEKVAGSGDGSAADRGPAGISDWEAKRQAKDIAERAMLLKVREVVTGMDGLDETLLARLVCGIMLESLFEYDQGEVVMGFLEKLGYSIPSESAREEMDLAAQVKEARFAIFEDLGGVGTGQHTDAWLVIVALLGSYAAFESPSGMAFLKELGIDADAMREAAVEQVKQADAERVKRAGEGKKKRQGVDEMGRRGEENGEMGGQGDGETAKKASKGAKKAPKTAKKAPKTAKKAAKVAKKAPKKG